MSVQIRTLPVLPLSEGVVLPGMVVTIALESDEAIAAADAALAADEPSLLLVPRLDGRYSGIGAMARIETAGELPSGQRAVVVRATGRARLGAGVSAPESGTALWLQAEPVEEPAADAHVEAIAHEYRITVEAFLERIGASRAIQALRSIDDPGALADALSEWPDLTLERRVELLETVDVAARLEKTTAWVRDALGELELKEKIRKDVSEGMEKQQREFLLRQQLAAIRKELGDAAESGDVVEEYRARLEAVAPPEHVRTAIERELERLERMNEQSPEVGWIRNWLDVALAIAWDTHVPEHLDVHGARATLDADTTGLADAKERIVEWLAVRKLSGERADAAPDTAGSPAPVRGDTDAVGDEEGGEGSTGLIAPEGPLIGSGGGPSARRDGVIMLLVGPPGVGKTSLGESVARATGRPFVRIALGGVRDEAEIRGHRRTYVGAQPGRIVKAMRDAHAMNPVILLDEVDKLGQGWAGDPSAALLEVLDPAQNHTFRDHYLDIDLDLSDVLFIATANSLDTIPAPLLDRMETITVDGYTDNEKVAIVRNHLLARQLRANALRPGEVELADAAILAVIEGHTREPGVRGLERELGRLLRKAALEIATGSTRTAVALRDGDDVRRYLGRPKRTVDELSGRVPTAGVATGLAVTGAGGDVLLVEATAMPASGDDTTLVVTGQLGDVMQESASIALSFVRANAAGLGIAPEAFRGRRLHVHFPAGAVPKDGPSAGITITTALVSLLADRPVRTDLAMTGEVTLQGRVLPIGGVKQKLLAAHRSGIRTVIVPARNEVDLDDLPQAVRDELDVHALDDVRDVLALAIG